MKTLLAAIDLEPDSIVVVRRATELACSLGADLHLVHVVDDTFTLYESLVEIPMRHRLEEAARRALQQFADTLPEELKARSHCDVILGKPAKALLSTARNIAADLIIVGRHHKDPLQDLFSGTTAEKLLRYSHIPLLLVTGGETGTYRKLVAATDFSRSSHHALKSALWVAPQAKIRLIHVFDPPFMGLARYRQQDMEELVVRQNARIKQEIAEEMLHFLGNDDQSRISTQVLSGETQACIAHVVDKQQSQLLVLGTHGRQGISRLMVGSVAMGFLSAPPCDVLVAK
ncbi:universal stress protein [Zobellella maritima]|uniref:universal stress protein n=1 Tax=Zobellella maritima TaxID=2059725 RepID=UPI000E2FF457|nr:universal stress protein [Zobellella maritima]